MGLACIVLIFAMASCLTSAEPVVNNKTATIPFIINGYDASRGQYPWMVSFIIPTVKGMSHNCGGTLIDPLYILTAAHCVINSKTGALTPGPWTMKIGCLNWRSDGEGQCDVRGAVAYKVHPNYKVGSLGSGYDIALIRLDSPSKMPLLGLASGFPLIGSTVTATGWGGTESGVYPDVLKWANLRISEIDSPQFQIRTGPEKSAICFGDSGGPIWTASAGQIGITSWTTADLGECWDTNVINGYTNVGSFRNWISETMTAMNPKPTSSISDGYDKTISLSGGRVAYEVCSCNAASVFGGKIMFDSKGQIWRFIPTPTQITPKRYYIQAASMSTCPGSGAQYLYLTAPPCDSNGDSCGTTGPFLAIATDTSRQAWILEEVSGGYKIKSASRVDSRYIDSSIGMSGDSGSLFFVSSISSSIFTISTTSDSVFYSCSAPQLPDPLPDLIPAPSPPSIPAPLPSPSPTPGPSPSPPPSPVPAPGEAIVDGKTCTAVTTVANPANTAWTNATPKVKKGIKSVSACRALCIFPVTRAYNYDTIKKICYLFSQDRQGLIRVRKPSFQSGALVCKQWQ
jgi:hypothetical protein